MNYRKPLCFLLLLFSFSCIAQSEIDSLMRLLVTELPDTTRVKTLNDLASKSFYKDPLMTDSLTDLSIALSQVLGYELGAAHGYKFKGISYAIRGRYETARSYYLQSLDYFEKMNNPDQVAALHYMIGITHLETGDIEKGMSSYTNALNAQKNTEDSLGMANTYVGISNLYKRTAKFELALVYLDSASYIYDRMGKFSEISIVRHNRTNLYTALNDYPKALEQAQLALEYNQANGLDQKVAMNFHNLGTIYQSLDERARAKEYFEKSIEMKEEMGMEGGVAISLSNLATLLADENQLNESKLAFLRVRQIYQKLNRSCNLIQVELNLASTYKGLNQLDSARYYLLRVQQGSGGCQADDLKAKADIALGQLYEEADDIIEAERLYLSGYELGESTRVNIIKMQAAERLYSLYKSGHNDSKALEYFEIAQSIEDSLFNEENNRRIARLESQFRFDQEKVILDEQYKQQQITQQAELSRARWVRNAVVAIAILVILLSLLIFFYYRKVQEKNGLLSKQNSQISQQNDELQKLNINNDKLLSLLAHDMQAPLANISSLFTLVELKELTDKEIDLLSKEIDFRIKNVLGFLENVLYWSQTQFNDINLQKLKLGIGWLVNDIIKMQQLDIDSKKIEMLVIPEGDDTIEADQDMLRVVFRNLISNAIKFSHEGGSIKVGIQSDDDELRISIQDYGIGMSKEVQDGLFQSILSSKRGTRNETGTGLGLYLSYDFVKAHSGRIEVLSKPDEGAQFVVHLPRKI